MTKLVSFTAAAEQTSAYRINGTAVVEFQGKRVELPAYQTQHTVGTSTWVSTTVRGFAARYDTGTKLWTATVDFNSAGKTTGVRAGLDNRVRRNTARLVGLWADVAETDKSEHIGERAA